MKKLLLTISAIAGFAFIVSAQEYGFEKGNVILEGSFQASKINNNLEARKESNVQFSPKVGFFLSDKFALGVEVGFGTRSLESTTSDVGLAEYKESNFGIGGFGRYYFLKVGSRFKTYTEIGAGYISSRDRISSPGLRYQDLKFNGFAANAGIGANFFLTEKIAINFLFADLLGYRTLKSDLPNAESNTSFVTNLNVFDNFFETASFGLSFKF